MFRTRTIAICLAVALGVTVATTPVTADAAINPKSKASVGAAYRNLLVPALNADLGWTGSADSCDAGTISNEAQAGTLAAVNYMRQLSGLSTVTFSAAYSAKAQQAALVYSANDKLEHAIPKSWDCYTDGAAAAGKKSNIAYGSGIAGALAIIGYMDDPGQYNDIVGHRRWILNPSTKVMGSGSTENAQVLWVQGTTAKKFKNPDWVEWPSSGYFPQQLEPDGRWSVTADDAFAWDFTRAKVTVTNAAGKRLKVSVESRSDIDKGEAGYANDTIVFKVAGVKKASGAGESAYTVKVTGITKIGSKKKISHSYKVKLFDATND